MSDHPASMLLNVATGGVTLGSILGFIPVWGGILGIVWYSILIYESMSGSKFKDSKLAKRIMGVFGREHPQNP
jgi:hypothetical protein